MKSLFALFATESRSRSIERQIRYKFSGICSGEGIKKGPKLSSGTVEELTWVTRHPRLRV